MDKKKIIIIGIVILIAVSAIAIMFLNTVNYERIEIVSNGTSIEVPANQTRYRGDIDGVRIWNWNDGALFAYNGIVSGDIINLNGFSFDTLEGIIKNGDLEVVDGVTCYVVNADELLEIHIFDIIKVNYNGKIYCIPLENESTQDNIIIFSKDRDVALHMAKSVEYKKVYPKDTALDDVESTVSDIAEDLQSKADNYVNSTDWNDVKSQIEDKAGDLLSKNPISS